MSSRALRKSQKKLESVELPDSPAEDTGTESDTSAQLVASKGGFAALAVSDSEDNESESETITADMPSEVRFQRDHNASTTSNATPKKKRKKGKKKTTKSNQDDHSNGLDEIDLALRSLNKEEKETASVKVDLASTSNHTDDQYKCFIVDSQHLHVANEMRRLFGNAALQEEENPGAGGEALDGAPRAVRRLQAHGRRGGRQSQSGSAAGAKRNMFVQPKPSWPPGATGGLGMEVERKESGTTYFKFVHSETYRDVQRQFYSCVDSYDPQRMIALLQFNPYHISTLLQVSDIMEQQGDHAVVGDLIERALFSFGRATHSTFARALSDGTARLDFRHPENREFWLAGWRYITNLSMRATWRTVLEWGKLLWALSPSEDPYAMKLVLDQYAVRARQQAWLFEYAEYVKQDAAQGEAGFSSPNLAYTFALAKAQSQDSSSATQARVVLRKALQDFPWMAAGLFRELNIDPLPPSIWGKEPLTELDRLRTELYATRSKDIWNTPEATALLMEVAQTTPRAEGTTEVTLAERDIDLTIGRHVFMTHKRELIALLPQNITKQLHSSSDPLPPLNSYDPYGIISEQRNAED